MKFQQFWNELSTELRHKNQFVTLKRSSEFKARFQYPNSVIVTPEATNNPRPISKSKFEEIWKIIRNDVRSERGSHTNQRFGSNRNPSYICALIDHIVKDQNME